ncbi:MAG: hypothetical protein ACK4UJ_05490 [Leptonema sp. (in: bacteria)]
MLETEVKNYLREIIKKYFEILTKKRIQRGKLILEEEMIYESLRNPKKGDVKIILIFDKKYQIFFEDKKHPKSYLSLMNDEEAGIFPERRAIDYYISIPNHPKENYNLYLTTPRDREILKNTKENIWEFYSLELEIVENFELPKEEIPENVDTLSWDDKWKIYRKLNELDNRKKELHKQLFGFKIKYKKYKSPEEEKNFIIDPGSVTQIVGMISREIYPPNLRTVLRRDYKREHQQLLEYTKKILTQLSELVQEKKSLFKNSSHYIEHLESIEKEISRQISLLE